MSETNTDDRMQLAGNLAKRMMKKNQLSTISSEPHVTQPAGIGEPNCETCHGIGYVRWDVPPSHPQFGKLAPCPTCRADWKEQIYKRKYHAKLKLIEQYGIIPRRNSTFKTFQINNATKSIRAAYLASHDFAQRDTGNWLILYGTYGTGKTHLAMAVANHLRERSRTVLLATVPGLLDLLRSGYQRDDHDEIMRVSQTVDVLILDDLGVENATDWSREKLFQIINHRYNNTPNLPIMITTNKPLDTLPPRLTSRMMDIQSTIIRVEGPDYRIKRRKA